MSIIKENRIIHRLPCVALIVFLLFLLCIDLCRAEGKLKPPVWRVYYKNGAVEDYSSPPGFATGIWRVEKHWQTYDTRRIWITSNKGVYYDIVGAKERWGWNGREWMNISDLEKKFPDEFKKRVREQTPEHMAVQRVLSRLEIELMLVNGEMMLKQADLELADPKLGKAEKEIKKISRDGIVKSMANSRRFMAEGKDWLGELPKPPNSLYQIKQARWEILELESVLKYCSDKPGSGNWIAIHTHLKPELTRKAIDDLRMLLTKY